ncbi:MAG: hypothetical protein IT374_27200 [Polyangiaceae bacterium]|nr:hypothetical protein [Polyangiaceae bacterium]
MTTPLEAATAALPDHHRDALFGAIPTLIAAVAGADREFDDAEMLAVVDELLASERTLGAAFRHSPAAEAAFDALSRRAREGDRLELASALARIRPALAELPDELADLFRRFVKRMALHIASASGGFLGFGDPISDEERAVLHRLVIALDLPLEDAERASFGMAPPPGDDG